MKTFIVSVVINIRYPARNFWSESKTTTRLTQHFREAETEEVAEALAVHYAIVERETEDRNSARPFGVTVTLHSVVSWDITDRLK